MTADPLANTGLTEDGFVAPREGEFVRYIRDVYEKMTGESPDWEETEYLGASTAAVAEVCAEMAGQVQDLYEARDPRQASGIHLEALSLIVGVDRRPATRGLALVTLEGDLGVVVPAGKEVRGGGPKGRLHWQLPEDVVIGAVFEFGGVTDGETYTVEAGGETVEVTAESGDDVDRIIRELAEAAEGLGAIPEANAVDINQDDAADFLELRPDPANPAGPAVTTTGNDTITKSAGAFTLVEAKRAGELLAPVGTIDEIATPVKGWTDVGHFQTIPGQYRESDEQLRTRRQQAMAAAGAGSTASIRANLLGLDFIVSAIVEDNPTDSPTSVAGYELEPHSYIAILYSANLTEQQKKQVARTLWATGPTGIPTMPVDGSGDSATIIAGDDIEHQMRWAYASTVPVSVDIDITLEPTYEQYEVVGAIEHKVAKYFASLGVAERVARSKLFGRLDDIEGIESIREIRLDGATDAVVPGRAPIAQLGSGQPTVQRVV